jgi:hypothetical protein
MTRATYGTEADTNELLQAGKQPAALRLADLLEKTSAIPLHGKAADELRRLSGERDGLLTALEDARAALSEIRHAHMNPGWFTKGEAAANQHIHTWMRRGLDGANAAIARATGSTE